MQGTTLVSWVTVYLESTVLTRTQGVAGVRMVQVLPLPAPLLDKEGLG